jgi:disulfide oxidoreductase YuzD
MTNNKQKTAVEWFIEQLNSKYGGNDFVITHINEIEKAKEMEKQQAIKLHYEYELYVMMNESDVMTFGQFYKQTYGGGE